MDTIMHRACLYCGEHVTYPCDRPSEAVECDGMKEEPVTSIDAVNHPHHYARWPMEPIEFIAINDLPWWLANVIKYTMRFDAKDGLKDLYKARSYLDMKIREVEGHRDFWDKPVAEERALAVGPVRSSVPAVDVRELADTLERRVPRYDDAVGHTVAAQDARVSGAARSLDVT